MTRIHQTRIGALLVAAAFVAALWPAAAVAQDQAAPKDKPQAQAPMRPRDMIKDLNITPEQQKKIQEFREARRKDAQAFREQMTKMRTEMRDLMKDTKANAAKIDALIDSRAKLRADREKAAFRTRGEFEKLFTPEQMEKMKTYRGAFMRRGGFFGPGRGRLMGPMSGWGMGRGFWRGAVWGWRMHAAAWRWRHPFFWLGR